MSTTELFPINIQLYRQHHNMPQVYTAHLHHIANAALLIPKTQFTQQHDTCYAHHAVLHCSSAPINQFTPVILHICLTNRCGINSVLARQPSSLSHIGTRRWTFCHLADLRAIRSWVLLPWETRSWRRREGSCESLAPSPREQSGQCHGDASFH